MINSKNNSVVTPEMPSSKLALSESWNRGNIELAASVIQTWPVQSSSNDLRFMVT